MGKGAAILWNKEDVKRRSVLAEQKVGTEASYPTVLTSRKRKRNPEEWKNNLRKKAVNTGQEFSYQVKNNKDGQMITKKIKKREIKPPCQEKCRLQCSKSFTNEERLKIFHKFYNTGDKCKQSQQLATLVTQAPKKRSTKDENYQPKRNREFTRLYTLIRNGVQVKVCSTMFLNTLGINKKRVRTVLSNVTDTGAPLVDGRGRHKNHKTSEEREKLVIEHISCFKVVESHYVRKDAKYEYLPKELSVAEMYRMYSEWCSKKGYTLENYAFYYRVFKEKFNLKFQQPKKDKCDTCEAYNNLDKTQIDKEVEQSQKNHLHDKDRVREIKETCKKMASENTDVLAAAFDLQKVLLCPFGQTSSFYYSRRLTNHNFTITELDNMDTYCYFWNESQCRKGSVEVATCLKKFIQKRSEDGIRDFFLFCDRCGGQNNNRMIFIMLSDIMYTCGINSITLIYLVSGHSHSENDNAHSMIEQMVRNKTIYTSAEWETIIKCAFKKNRCFLEVLNHRDIIDYKNVSAFPEFNSVMLDKTEEEMTAKEKEQQKALNETIGMSNRKVNKVYWSEIVELKFEYNNPEQIFFKYSYDEGYRKATFSAPKREIRKKELVQRKKHMEKYPFPCGISSQKKEDLKKLCSKGLIPERHHSFFDNLPVTK
ncbi:uncharacterized protein LOC130642101 [Hydractinia symbiolongicarpus]|uniref:uncharacterized protein LOC130642101 n=1 Tax=Hydractinia symbiolongicarpus TaxID=13093 RepID=UPI00254F02CC|nr:uncharacterized protein LOC130642101 [Hydractinia symbiolongicarpus]